MLIEASSHKEIWNKLNSKNSVNICAVCIMFNYIFELRMFGGIFSGAG